MGNYNNILLLFWVMKFESANRAVKKTETRYSDLTINERLKSVRELLDLNQKMMAEMLSIRQSNLSDIEKNRRTLSAKLIDRIVQKFSVSKDWLYTGKGKIFTDDTLNKQSDQLGDIEDDNVCNIEVSSKLLDDIINKHFHIIGFYCTDILYRSYHFNNPDVKSSIPQKAVDAIEKYLYQMKAKPFDRDDSNIENSQELTGEDKIEIIKALTETTSNILDEVWQLTQGVWLKK